MRLEQDRNADDEKLATVFDSSKWSLDVRANLQMVDDFLSQEVIDRYGAIEWKLKIILAATGPNYF